MSEFPPAIQYVLENECDDMATSGQRIADVGFTDDPFDMGGSTVYGLSRAIRYRESLMPMDLGIASFSNADLKTVTRANAEAVFRQIYWVKFGYDRIINQDVATKVMDSAVNLNWPKGTYRIPAHLIAQIACNGLGYAGASDDAYLNKITRVGWMQKWKFVPWTLWNELWDARATGTRDALIGTQANVIARIIEHEMKDAEVELSDRDESLIQALYSGDARVEVKMGAALASQDQLEEWRTGGLSRVRARGGARPRRVREGRVRREGSRQVLVCLAAPGTVAPEPRRVRHQVGGPRGNPDQARRRRDADHRADAPGHPLRHARALRGLVPQREAPGDGRLPGGLWWSERGPGGS